MLLFISMTGKTRYMPPHLLSHLYTVAEAELFKHVNVTTPDMVGRNRMAAAIKVTASVFSIWDVDLSLSRISANNISDNHSFFECVECGKFGIHCNPGQGRTGKRQVYPCNVNRIPAMMTEFPAMILEKTPF